VVGLQQRLLSSTEAFARSVRAPPHRRATVEFLLDYEIDEEEWGNKKKPCRYRWPDAVRDEVLGRLRELNAKRAAEKKRSGAAAGTAAKKKPRSKKAGNEPALF
jgi:hypothetical protein